MNAIQRSLVLVLVVQLQSAIPLTQAAESTGSELLASINRAPWADTIKQSALEMAARRAPVFSSRTLAALRAARGATAIDVARITVLKAGFLLDAELQPAQYVLSLAADGRDYRLLLRDAEGRLLGCDGCWITGDEDSEPVVELKADGEAFKLLLKCGGISFNYRFVPAEALAKTWAGQRYVAGHIALNSDLDESTAREIARQLDASLPFHCKLLERTPTDQPFEISLGRSRERYESFDRLVTGGNFQQNGAVTAKLVQRSFIFWWSQPESTDLPLPLGKRALAIHELHHLVTNRLYREAGCWPVGLKWLSEGLAENATYDALAAASPADAKAFHERMLGRFQLAARMGTLPELEDLLARYVDRDMNAWYSSAYLLVRAVRKQPALMKELLACLDGIHIDRRMVSEARAVLDRHGGAAAIWGRAREEALAQPVPFALINGDLDPLGDALRVATDGGGFARVLMLHRPHGPEATLTARIAWQPVGKRQVDLYFGWLAGRQEERFLKIGILPRRLVLFEFSGGQWEMIDALDCPDALAESAPGKPVWHAVNAELHAGKRRLLVSAGNHKAEFSLPRPPPVEGALAGFGALDSIVYVKDLNLR